MKMPTPSSIAIELLRSFHVEGESKLHTDPGHSGAIAVLNGMAADQRRILILFYTESRDYEEIADKMGSDLIAVQKLRGTAFQQFVRILRASGVVRRKGKDWFLRGGPPRQIKGKLVPKAHCILPKWPSNICEAHKVLNVSPNLSMRAKSIGFLRMVRKFHPDQAFMLHSDVGAMMEEGMKRINRTWEMICAEQDQWP